MASTKISKELLIKAYNFMNSRGLIKFTDYIEFNAEIEEIAFWTKNQSLLGSLDYLSKVKPFINKETPK